jgi:hypothetical protein
VVPKSNVSNDLNSKKMPPNDDKSGGSELPGETSLNKSNKSGGVDLHGKESLGTSSGVDRQPRIGDEKKTEQVGDGRITKHSPRDKYRFSRSRSDPTGIIEREKRRASTSMDTEDDNESHSEHKDGTWNGFVPFSPSRSFRNFGQRMSELFTPSSRMQDSFRDFRTRVRTLSEGLFDRESLESNDVDNNSTTSSQNVSLPDRRITRSSSIPLLDLTDRVSSGISSETDHEPDTQRTVKTTESDESHRGISTQDDAVSQN